MYLLFTKPNLKIKSPSPYVIWDGTSVTEYQPTDVHDCAILTDGLVSVQNLRRDCINAGFEPIVFFSCKGGMPSYHVNFPAIGWEGLFTQSMWNVFYRGITIKELIEQINAEMKKTGLNQVSEVICRLELLNSIYLTEYFKDKKIAYLTFDMCRTPGSRRLKISNVMTNNYLNDFIELIASNETEVPILEYRIKDLYSAVGVMLTVLDSGLISVILNILNLWSQKYYNATIKISYQSIHDEQIEVTYSQLSKQDTENILSQHPPKVGDKINLQFPTEEQFN